MHMSPHLRSLPWFLQKESSGPLGKPWAFFCYSIDHFMLFVYLVMCWMPSMCQASFGIYKIKYMVFLLLSLNLTRRQTQMKIIPVINMITMTQKWSRSVVSDSLWPHRLTVAYQAPLSMGFPRQEYWSGLPFPSPGDLPNPGIEPGSSAL